MEVTEKPKTELSLQQRAAVAIGSSELEENLKALAAKHTDIVAINNGAARDQVHGAAMTLKNNRVAIQKTGKAAREDAAAFQKAVIAEETRLIGLIEPEEQRLFALRDGYDTKVQAERDAKIAAERQRIEGIKERIAMIVAAPIGTVGKTADEIASLAQCIAAGVPDETFEEFQAEVLAAHEKSASAIREAYDAAVTAEARAKEEESARAAEAVRIAAEREELAQLRKQQQEAAAAQQKQLEAERAEIAKQRTAEEAKAAELRKAEEAKFAEQRAELAKQQAAIDAQRQAQEAAAAAEQTKRDAEAKAAVEAEAKRLQDAADEAERQERAAAQARKEAEDEQHMAEVHAAIVAALVANDWREGHARALIDLIRAGTVPSHVTITY